MATMRELIQNELKKGLTQRELAQKIGFSHGTIQKILFTDTRFTFETRKKVADYFRVPVAQFYEDIEVAEAIAVKTSMPHQESKIDDLQRSVMRLYESLVDLQKQLLKIDHDLGQEIGTIKDRLMDAAATGDIKRLDIISIKGPSRIN